MADTVQFFTLKPNVLADLLTQQLEATNPNLSEFQKLSASSSMITLTGKALRIAEERARFGFGQGVPARVESSPISSRARVGTHEDDLYAYIQAGDIEAVRSVAVPQVYTSTAHPSFGRSKGKQNATNKLLQLIANLPFEKLQEIEKTGKLPEDTARLMQGEIDEVAKNLEPRAKPRTRVEELQETVLDTIPTIFGGDLEQLNIMKKRGSFTFANVKQIQAAAETLPEFNNWFLDGDGKRTVHVYDTELAIPATKLKTLEEYQAALEEIYKKTQDIEIKELLTKIEGKIKLYEDLVNLTEDRIDALNKVHATKDFDDNNAKAREAHEDAKKDAARIAQEYKAKLKEDFNGMPVRAVLTGDDTAEIKQQFERVLTAHYEGTKKLDNDLLDLAEGTYASAHRRGNYASKLQRRENARQYEEVLSYLIENNEKLRERLCTALNCDEEGLQDELVDKEGYLKVIKLMAESVQSADDPLQIRDTFSKTYRKLARKLGRESKKSGEFIVTPLEPRELLTLDALGQFHMSQLYPEAMGGNSNIRGGGFVIAEFGQPATDTLRSNDPDIIREAVVYQSQVDMTIQVMLATAMQAEGTRLIPLNEDPEVMKHGAAAKTALLKEPVYQKYLRGFVGVNTAEELDQKCMKLAVEGDKPKFYSAYDLLLREGETEAQMLARGKDIEKLKKTRVIAGPDDMSACSDNKKRGGIFGFVLAMMATREGLIASCSAPYEVDGESFVIVHPKYYGQGGSMMRATGVPMEIEQDTRQGEHMMWMTPQALAIESMNRMLSRLAIRHGVKADAAIQDHAAGVGSNVSNRLGIPKNELKETQREILYSTMDRYVEHTRDDPWCDDYLRKNGIEVTNWSARPNNKTKSEYIFSPGRAIGIAGMMMRQMNNIITAGTAFDFGNMGEGKGEVTEKSIKEMREWIAENAAVQQVFASAAFMANIVGPAKTWARKGLTLSEDKKYLTNADGQTISLEKLTDEFDKDENRKTKGFTFTDSKTGITFDSADLYLADLTRQYDMLEKGLLAVYGKQSLIELFEPEHQGTVLHYKKSYDKMIDMYDKGKLTKDQMSMIYYDLFESGPEMYPMPGLLEQKLYEQRVENNRGDQPTSATRATEDLQNLQTVARQGSLIDKPTDIALL